MNEHKIEREAVIWAWKTLYEDEAPRDGTIERLVNHVLAGTPETPVVKVAIAYVEGIKNHLDTVLELETNLARATEELVSLRTVAAYYRIADYNQRRCANTGTVEYRKAAEALDKALGAGPGEAPCTPDR